MLSHLDKIQPTDSRQIAKLTDALSELTPEQKIWLSGFLAGQSVDTQANRAQTPTKSTALNPESKLTILYGSQTGNARLLAETYLEQAQAQGFQVSLVSLADFKPRQITKEHNIVLIVSTHGEGDAPDDAEIFYEYLYSKKAPKLDQLSFSVLSLGDSSYEQFCQTGVDFDVQLEKLGAKRIIDRVDCDLDFEADAKLWQQKTLKEFAKILLSDNESNVVPLSIIKNDEVKYNRNNPYFAEILALQRITTDDSVKKIYHIELSLEDSNMDYLPGDSLGVITINSSENVLALLKQAKINPNESVSYQGQELSIEYLLTEVLEISLLNKKFLKFYIDICESSELYSLIDSQDSFNEFVKNRQLIDVIQQFPAPISAQDLADHLIKITPRLYSISSSHKANPDEVHLTIALVEIESERTGLVSGSLCRDAEEGDLVKVYIETNNNFKIPEDPNTPTIMVGPGTGVAPFRGFLQEREELDHSGGNWLFFGNPSFENDFLYQLEWQSFIKSGVLNKIDLAFSRDQQQKIYVQHRLQESAKQVWEWLENGAHFYICGDKDYMAKDVEITLLNIIKEQGNLSEQQSVDFLKQLKRDKRYQKDVY